MATQLTANEVQNSRRTKTIEFQLALSGNFPGAAGDPVDFTNVLNPKFLQGVFPGEVPGNPPIVENMPDGYDANFIPGTGTTLQTAWALVVYSTAGTLLATGAYPAGLTAPATPLLVTIKGGNWRL